MLLLPQVKVEIVERIANYHSYHFMNFILTNNIENLVMYVQSCLHKVRQKTPSKPAECQDFYVYVL